MSYATVTSDTTQLLIAARQGAPLAWRQLIERYERMLRATARSFRLNEADRDDAVQLTWISLMENADKIRDPERLAGWLNTTVTRECLKLIRRSSREVAPGEGPAVDQIADERTETTAVDGLMTEELWRLVDELPARRRLLMR